MSDPYFANVVLLLHCNGTDGSTTITDSSSAAQTVVAFGNAQIDTGVSLYGGASLERAADGDIIYIETPGGSPNSFMFGTGDFTIEGQENSTDASYLLASYYEPTTARGWYLWVNASGYLEWWVGDGSGANMLAGATSGAVNTGAFKPWSVCRLSGTLRLFVEGAVVASASDSTNYNTYADELITFFGDSGGTYVGAGHGDEIRVTKGIGRYGSGGYTPQTGPFPDSGVAAVTGEIAAASMLGTPALLGHGLYGRASAASMLGAPALLGSMVHGRAAAASMLGAPTMLGWHDFTGQIDLSAPTTYVMDLVTPGGLVRAPISSWQATLQTDEACYAQCVVPACTDWVTAISTATEFVVSRVATVVDGSTLEYEMARAPVEQVALSKGVHNYTATISGYTDALTGDDDPPAAYDRTLTGVRTVTRNNGLTRIRCDTDWLLRPGHRAYLDDEPIIVAFINFYMPGFDQYMDVGDRA